MNKKVQKNFIILCKILIGSGLYFGRLIDKMSKNERIFNKNLWH